LKNEYVIHIFLT